MLELISKLLKITANPNVFPDVQLSHETATAFDHAYKFVSYPNSRQSTSNNKKKNDVSKRVQFDIIDAILTIFSLTNSVNVNTSINYETHVITSHSTIQSSQEVNNSSAIVNRLCSIVKKWIARCDEWKEYLTIIQKRSVSEIVQWPVKVQVLYFKKFLMTNIFHLKNNEFVSNTLKMIEDIILTQNLSFDLRKEYLLLIQKGYHSAKQQNKIIQVFTDCLLQRLKVTRIQEEQVLLLRLICLFYKNMMSERNDQYCANVSSNIQYIYNQGMLANLATQSYVDMLLNLTPEASLTGRSVDK